LSTWGMLGRSLGVTSLSHGVRLALGMLGRHWGLGAARHWQRP
jgi:hypothetical protein